MTWKDVSLESGAVPLWFQISNILRAAIAAGEFKPGSALPSEAELFRVFGVSRTTARSALDKLENEGLIVRQSGRGSIVMEPRVEQPLNMLAGFSEDMRRRGLTASYRTLSAGFGAAPAKVRTSLLSGTSEQIFVTHRLLKANDKIIATSVSWIPAGIFDRHAPPGVEDLDRGSLYSWLELNCGVRITGGHQTIEAEIALGETARQLEVSPGSAVLVAERLSTDHAGNPVELAIMSYRSDRYRFRLDLA